MVFCSCKANSDTADKLINENYTVEHDVMDVYEVDTIVKAVITLDTLEND